MRFGVPYQGSKNAVACDIIGVLPSAPRFVDLFAGGCALTHAAAISGKYKSFVSNDINPFGIDLFFNSVTGAYDSEDRWISREDFDILKKTDSFVSLVWSFGNNQKQYLYGEQIEGYKRALHLAYFGTDYDTAFREYRLDLKPLADVPQSKKSKVLWKICETAFKAGKLPPLGKRIQMCYIQHIGRLKDIQAIRYLERTVMGRLKLICGDYRDVPLHDDDCVICDIPYASTCGYGGKESAFDHAAFCKWALEKKFPIFVCEYDMPDGFMPIWGRGRWDTFGKRGKQSTRAERLWVQSRFAAEYKCDLFGFGKGGKV